MKHVKNYCSLYGVIILYFKNDFDILSLHLFSSVCKPLTYCMTPKDLNAKCTI